MKFINLEKIKPETFFLFFALFFGITILFVTPPFQIPDEINHFYKSYQVSEGHFISTKQDNRVGGYVPLSVKKVTEPFIWLRWNENTKTNKEIIFNTLNVPLNPTEKVFVDFPNTALYPFISYIPQAFTIFIFRIFSTPPLWLFYLARLTSFLFWVLCIFYSLKTMPFYKWFFVFLALLPMSLFINMSLSADVVTNGLAFLLIASVLKVAFSNSTFSNRAFYFIVLLTLLLASSKLVYAPIIILFFIIPREKFITNKIFYIRAGVLFIMTFLTVFSWSYIMSSLYLPYSQYNPAFRDIDSLIKDADMHLQLNYIVTHGSYFLSVIYNSLVRAFDMYYRGYIGTFGWLDTQLPYWLINSSYMAIFLLAFINNDSKLILKPQQKIIILNAFLCSLFLVLLSQHLTWDGVGGELIYTIQGRYLIPVLPLFFLLFYNSKINYSKFVVPIVILFSSLGLSVSVYTLIIRYYFNP